MVRRHVLLMLAVKFNAKTIFILEITNVNNLQNEQEVNFHVCAKCGVMIKCAKYKKREHG